MSGEFDLIRWFREHARSAGPEAALGIGDDCALLQVRPGASLAITTDMLMDGRHFRLERDGPEAVGFKAMSVNLSDVAAMAARPVAAVVALALPKQFGRAESLARGLFTGLDDAARRFGVSIVGGDTNAWDGPLVVSVTVLGETTELGAVTRSGARVGDVIFVTGPLGGSLLGRHLRPTPRVSEALALHSVASLHAMIDVSDGLSSDLGHILEESGGLGAVLDASSVPVHPDALEMARSDGRSPLDHALNDGEDFELCVVVPAEDAERLFRTPPEGVTLFRVGEIVARPGLWLQGEGGTLTPIKAAGFDHWNA